MKKIYRRWHEQNTGKKGYSFAEVTYRIEVVIGDYTREIYGRDRAKLCTAINDGKKAFEKYGSSADINVYAFALLSEHYDDGTQAYNTMSDCVRVGAIQFGEYFDLCESAEWL